MNTVAKTSVRYAFLGVLLASAAEVLLEALGVSGVDFWNAPILFAIFGLAEGLGKAGEDALDHMEVSR